MKAGVDFGSTLVKAYFKDRHGTPMYISSADTSPEEIALFLRRSGVTEIRAVGQGRYPAFDGFDVVRPHGDPVDEELRLQAEGALRLCEHLRAPTARPLWVVSIGTGTSFTVMTKDGPLRFRPGTGIGGGTLDGLGKFLMAAERFLGPASHASARRDGEVLDIRVKDRVPSLAGTMEGEYVLSHFGKADGRSAPDDMVATLVHCVATVIINFLLVMERVPGFGGCKEVLYIGTPVARLPSLKQWLTVYTNAVNLKPIFPMAGEFSGAVGAFYQDA